MKKKKKGKTLIELSEFEKKDCDLFNRIVKEYTRKDLDPGSRIARKRRLNATIGCIKNIPRNPEILEVGCAGGFSASYLEGKYSKYVGIDYADKLIDYAKNSNRGRKSVTFEVCNVRDYNTSEPYDIILLIGVLHHLDDLNESLNHLKTLIKPGGWIVANEPQSSNPIINLARNVRKYIDRDYSSEQICFSPVQLQNAYQNVGFINVEIHAQGLFSTPFAEVIFSPKWLSKILAVASVKMDTLIESIFGRMLLPISWNIVAVGQAPRHD